MSASLLHSAPLESDQPVQPAAMPPGKNSTLPTSETSKVLEPKPTNVSSGKAPKQTTSPPVEETPKVVMLENGLVSMAKTPEHLVEVVKRNAKESPLLRLPVEIREIICKFAMGGNLVIIKHSEIPVQARYPKHHGSAYCGKLSGVKQKRPSAFHLPEVCRQLYSETATLGYALNTFMWNQDDFAGRFVRLCDMLRVWTQKRVPAHINAITDVQFDALPATRGERDIVDVVTSMKAVLPSIKRVYHPIFEFAFVDPLERDEYVENVPSELMRQEHPDIQLILD